MSGNDEILRLKAQASIMRSRIEELEKASEGLFQAREALKEHEEALVELKQKCATLEEALEQANFQIAELEIEGQRLARENELAQDDLEMIFGDNERSILEFMRTIPEEYRALLNKCAYSGSLIKLVKNCVRPEFIADVWKEARAHCLSSPLSEPAAFLEKLYNIHLFLTPSSELCIFAKSVDDVLNGINLAGCWAMPYYTSWWVNCQIDHVKTPGLAGDSIYVEPLLALNI